MNMDIANIILLVTLALHGAVMRSRAQRLTKQLRYTERIAGLQMMIGDIDNLVIAALKSDQSIGEKVDMVRRLMVQKEELVKRRNHLKEQEEQYKK